MTKLISAETLDNLINHMINLYDCQAFALGDKLYDTLKEAFANGRLDEWQFQLVANTRNTMLQKSDVDCYSPSLLDRWGLDDDGGWLTSNMPVVSIYPGQAPTFDGLLSDRNVKTGVCIYQ
jgi:hypothetical protein